MVLQDFGLLLGAVGLARMMIAVADFGINLSAVRDLARDPTATSAFIDALASKLVIAVLLGAAALVAAGAAVAGGILPAALLLLGLFVSLEVVAATLQVPLRAVRRTGLVSFLTVLDAALPLVVVAAALRAGDDAIIVALPSGLVIGAFLVTVSTWWMLEPRFRDLARPTLRGCWHVQGVGALRPPASMTPHLQRADVAIVGMVAGPVAAGLFAVPARLTSPSRSSRTPSAPRCFRGSPARMTGPRRTVPWSGGRRFCSAVRASFSAGCSCWRSQRSALPSVPRTYQAPRCCVVTLVGVLVAALNQPMALFLRRGARALRRPGANRRLGRRAGWHRGWRVSDGGLRRRLRLRAPATRRRGCLAVLVARVLDRRQSPVSMLGEVHD